MASGGPTSGGPTSGGPASPTQKSPPSQKSPSQRGSPTQGSRPPSGVTSPTSTSTKGTAQPTYKPKRPYEEIGAVFNGNEVKIRVPKTTFKPPKLTPSQQNLQQQCTCEDDGSVCSDQCGFPSQKDTRGPANKLNFQIPDDICEGLTNRTAMNSELIYCKKEAHDTLCNVCNVTPADAPKGVQAQKVVCPDKDVFLLKIGKQTDEPNRTGNIEVELITPRAPAKPKPATHSCKQIQCEEGDLPACLMCRTCAPVMRKRRTRRARCYCK